MRNIATIGITNYAQGELGDIVYVELPEVGTEVYPILGIRRCGIDENRVGFFFPRFPVRLSNPTRGFSTIPKP